MVVYPAFAYFYFLRHDDKPRRGRAYRCRNCLGLLSQGRKLRPSDARGKSHHICSRRRSYAEKLNIVKPLQFLIFAVATALIHAVTETAAVYIAIAAGLSIPENGMLYIWGATFAGTIGHSLLDCTVAYLISRLILKAHVVDMPPLMKENH